LRTVGGFDERFFMYLEDVDLSRRIGRVARTVYVPYVSLIHAYEKGSYKSMKLFFYHVHSAIRYFNKWGWFRDPGREAINRATLRQIECMSSKNKVDGRSS
jgi:GT2 family glycosyltransferase